MIIKSVVTTALFLLVCMGYAATEIEFDALYKGSSVSSDRETLNCLQCHDGVMADDVEILLSGGEPGMGGLHLGKHPVGMKYTDYVIAAPLDYRPLESLSASILLVDGRVSCVSCHRIKQAGETLVSSQLSAAADNLCIFSSEIKTEVGMTGLCQSCHIK